MRWYLELEWSSGRRHDVLRVDDQGKPFRTSGKEGRPLYSWSGSDEWEREGLDGRRTLDISKVPTEDDS
ncbi:hypothetical protein ACGFSB_29115 [Streptomyces sp. NPDC048441]|uniref:hypothetical protein n=1 Tax=Streptomyces sp. NPDC048441 TaxID=3365552 RepID=UPI00370FF9F0